MSNFGPCMGERRYHLYLYLVVLGPSVVLDLVFFPHRNTVVDCPVAEVQSLIVGIFDRFALFSFCQLVLVSIIYRDLCELYPLVGVDLERLERCWMRGTLHTWLSAEQ